MPYYIYTAGQLLKASQIVNDGTMPSAHFVLAADIDYFDNEWTPIGSGVKYTGIFDGNGHKVSNLKVTTYNETANLQGVGFFGKTSATIKNLGIENISVIVQPKWGSGVGGMVGYANGGSVTNCYVKDATVSYNASGTTVFVGGFVGKTDSGASFANNYVYNSKVCNRLSFPTGGFVGNNGATNCSYTNCFAAGITVDPTISDWTQRARTIYGFGYADDATKMPATVTNCYSTLASSQGGQDSPTYTNTKDIGRVDANYTLPIAGATKATIVDAFSNVVDEDSNRIFKTDSEINNGYPCFV